MRHLQKIKVVGALALGLGLLARPTVAQAQFFTLPTNLTTAQTDAILKLLTADTAFRSVEPASAFGNAFGFSLGVVGVMTMGTALNSVVPGASTGFIPAAMIAGTIQAPLGLALEIGFLPTLTLGTASFGIFGIGAKWTFSDMIPLLPLSAAVRIGYTSPRIQYSLTSPVPTTMTYTAGTFNASLMISKALSVFEPYLGLSFYSASARLETTATAFFQSATAAVTSSPSGIGFVGGLDIKLTVVALAIQYENTLGNDTILGRVGVRF